MTTTRVMFVGQGASGLPEDRFINVFHFHDPTVLPWDDSMPELLEALEDFYTEPNTNGSTIGQMISPYVNRTAQLVFYNLGQAPPRTPVPWDITLPAPLAGSLPEEVAVCLTLLGAPPVTARRRGRIFLGPLVSSSAVMAPAGTTSPTRVGSTLSVTLKQAATRLQVAAAAAGVPWCVRSTVPSENFVPIVGGYIDDAFDTQRRRGPDDTVRTAWP